MNRIPRSIAVLACVGLLLAAPAAWAAPAAGLAPGSADRAPATQLEASGPSWVDVALRALARLWPSAAPAAPETERPRSSAGAAEADDSLVSGPTASGGPMCDPLKAEIGCSNDPDG